MQREFLFGARTLSVTCGDSSPFRGRWICEAKTERVPPACAKQKLSRSAALSQKAALHLPLPSTTPPRENGIAERPQTLRYSEIINILSAIYAQSNAARILNRPALGGLHHKIRCFLNAVLRKIPLLQRHPPGGKIRVARALPRL